MNELLDFLRRLIHPEDLGHAVTAEVRQVAAELLKKHGDPQ